MISPCNPHNPSEAEDKKKENKEEQEMKLNREEKEKKKLTALMMTAQLRPETPSVQKLRNETLENGKHTRTQHERKQKQQQKNECAHTPSSLTSRALARSLARSRNPNPLLRFSH
jgi:hypothetical protein